VDTLNEKIRSAILKSAEDWLADGRDELRPVFTAIGMDRIVEIVLFRLGENAQYLALIDRIAQADREADAVLGLIGLAKTALSAAMAAGLLGG
jgi:hypothetical protein